MKLIKAIHTEDGEEVYFVGDETTFAWSSSINDASILEEDEANTMLHHIKHAADALDLPIEKVTLFESPHIGFVYSIEFVPILKVLEETFGDNVSKGYIAQIIEKFKSLVNEDEYPIEYLSQIGIDVVDGKIQITLPNDGEVPRIRILH